VLGYLFKYQSRKRKKTNLMVFLRPSVVRNDAESVAIAGDRYDYIRGAQQSVEPANNVFLPKADAPLLPPLQNGRPVGGAMLKREPLLNTDQLPQMQPLPPASVFPVEPPVINQR
jgi:general secretion pathway protein D